MNTIAIVLSVALPISLSQPGRVTVAVEREDGTRVRNLIADEPFEAGRHKLEWDGCDDYGEPVPTGSYRWRGLVHGDISASYLGSFYSPGSTPWKVHTYPGGWNIRAGGAGAWLSDHKAPYCVYTDDKYVYLGCTLAEAGDAIIQCDLDGNKIWGQLWLGLSGANAMCSDGDVLYVAGERGWQGERLGVTLYRPKERAFVPVPEEVRKRHVMHDAALVRESVSNFCGIAGMYLTTNHIVLALNDRRRLAFFNRSDGLFDHEEPLKNAKSIAMRPKAKVLRGLAVDADGNIFRCMTNECDQCVNVYSPEGKLIRTIGRRGGRIEGKYDPLAMGNPEDVAIDARGFVWVCENCFTPKRVSVWTREGALVRDYVGTPYYGGGGSLDGHIAYYAGMRFVFNDDYSQAKLDSVMWIPSKHEDLPFKLDPQGSFDMVRFRGKRYLIEDDGACRKYSAIYEETGDVMVPRVIVGNAKGGGVLLWQDGITTVIPNACYGAEWAMRFGPNLEIPLRLGAEGKHSRILVLKPMAGDALRYDPAVAETVTFAKEGNICSLAFLPDASGYVCNFGGLGSQGSNDNFFGAVSSDGKRVLWSYPNPYPSNGHNSPLPRRGELRHTIGVEGFSSAGTGEGGALFLLNGNKGARYLFTSDGLFVSELFGDMRVTDGSTQNFPSAKRGMDLASKSLSDECFGGWIGEVGDKTFVIEGKDSLNVCELKGIGSIRRLAGGKVELKEVAKRGDEIPASERPPIRPLRMGGFGFQSDWWKAMENKFPGGDRSPAKFAIGYGDAFLRLRIEVKDPTFFGNAGDDLWTVFHSGDAIDFRWARDPNAKPDRKSAAEGDLRFVIASTPRGMKVVRYTFVDSACTEPPVEFVSPVGKCKVARVEVMDKVKAVVEKSTDGYVLTADFPWKEALGEKGVPVFGERRGFDVGVIFGDATNSRVMRRAYYFDPGSQEVSDIPSETRVNPSAWGWMEF